MTIPTFTNMLDVRNPLSPISPYNPMRRNFSISGVNYMSGFEIFVTLSLFIVTISVMSYSGLSYVNDRPLNPFKQCK